VTLTEKGILKYPQQRWPEPPSKWEETTLRGSWKGLKMERHFSRGTAGGPEKGGERSPESRGPHHLSSKTVKVSMTQGEAPKTRRFSYKRRGEEHCAG